jgi:hypothetical protein
MNEQQSEVYSMEEVTGEITNQVSQDFADAGLQSSDEARRQRLEKDALLDEIERNNPKYQADIREALLEALNSTYDGPEMTVEEFGEWLTNL